MPALFYVFFYKCILEVRPWLINKIVTQLIYCRRKIFTPRYEPFLPCLEPHKAHSLGLPQ